MTLTPEGREGWRRPIERMCEVELQAARSIAPEDADTFMRVVERYAKSVRRSTRQAS